MARNGAGTYSLPQAAFVPGTVISATAVNSDFSDIANALTTSIASDGQTPITANLPMSGYRHTGVGNAAARTDYAAAGQVQDGAFIWCGTAGGTANALTLTPTPAITAYAAGQVFRFTAGASPNSGATTVAVSGLTAQAIQNAGAALTGGEIAAGRQYSILYDGTNFQLSPFASSTPGAGSVTTAMLQDNAVTNAKLADMAANTVKVRAAGTSGDPSDLTLAASQLLGRGASGDVAAIALGTGLSMSGATLNAASGPTLGTLTNTTSGTAIDITGIPSTARRIALCFNQVSTNGTSNVRVQIGDSGGIETSGYVGSNGSRTAEANFSSGIDFDFGSATAALVGVVHFSLVDSATNTWACIYVISSPASSQSVRYGSAIKPLSATLDRLRVTTVGGTDAFDGGSINVVYD